MHIGYLVFLGHCFIHEAMLSFFPPPTLAVLGINTVLHYSLKNTIFILQLKENTLRNTQQFEYQMWEILDPTLP